MSSLMVKWCPVAAAVALLTLPGQAGADLAVGAKAPPIVTQGALAGKIFDFNLQAALKQGPVVVYFYPKSFTQGCTLEAHAFAEAMPQFRAAGATVIGLSADTIQTQQEFSRKDCRDQFAVGVATPALIAAYDVHLKRADGSATGVSSRTSYVIGRNGKVQLAYTNMSPNDHVRVTLQAVQAMRRAARR